MEKYNLNQLQKNVSEQPQMKRWEDLTLADNFIFQKFMRNESLCKKILGEILGKEILKIEYPEYEKVIGIRHDAKGIRLDVYVRGDDEVYNIEMQNARSGELPKRGRYYRDLIDLDLLERGQDYSMLCRSFIIFICTYDLYGKNQYRYTFTYQCKEIDGLEYGDQTTMIILNTMGTEGNVSEDLKTFLKCVAGLFPDDEFSATIREEYDRIKESREWRREYMTLEMALKEQFQAGEAKGHEAGLAEGHTEGIEDSIAIIRDLKNGKSVEWIAQKYQVDPDKVQALSELI